MKIEIISGSGRMDSITIRVAYALQYWIKENTTHEVGIIDCRDQAFQLPHLQQVYKSVDTTPDPYKSLSERMFGADGFIWISPEYNGSYSPLLKNLIDHYPKQLHKPLGVVTASDGAMGGIRAAQQMLLLGMGVFAIVSPQMLIVPQVETKFDATGKLIDEKFYRNIHNFIAEYLWIFDKLNS